MHAPHEAPVGPLLTWSVSPTVGCQRLRFGGGDGYLGTSGWHLAPRLFKVNCTRLMCASNGLFGLANLTAPPTLVVFDADARCTLGPGAP